MHFKLAVAVLLSVIGLIEAQSSNPTSSTTTSPSSSSSGTTTSGAPSSTSSTFQITITNGGSSTIWPATNNPGNLSGFMLGAGDTSPPIDLPMDWAGGRIWARTGCSGSGDSLTCDVGDCSGALQCGSEPEVLGPAKGFTLVEFGAPDGASYGNERTFDISAQQPYTYTASDSFQAALSVAVTIVPSPNPNTPDTSGGGGGCRTVSCTSNPCDDAYTEQETQPIKNHECSASTSYSITFGNAI